jgi:putative endonuclease
VNIYIMAGESGVLYVGVTGNLPKRVGQHKSKLLRGFTQKYNLIKLAWLEAHNSARAAISREKQIKTWRRQKKIALSEAMNTGLSLVPRQTNTSK